MILEAEEIVFLEGKSFECVSTLLPHTREEVQYSIISTAEGTNWKMSGLDLSHNNWRGNQNVLLVFPSNWLWYAFTPYH